MCYHYLSESKFTIGGKYTSGYVSSNQKASALMDNIKKYIELYENEATDLQIEIPEESKYYM